MTDDEMMMMMRCKMAACWTGESGKILKQD